MTFVKNGIIKPQMNMPVDNIFKQMAFGVYFSLILNLNTSYRNG